MSRYEEALRMIEEMCGNGKDNVISLATVDMDPNDAGKPRPCVRNVNAYFENGVFYSVTWANSNKMLQIAKNPEVAFTTFFEGFSGSGIGENLGWVLKPENAELRTKLRAVFADWYDDANNEKDENCSILAIRLTRGTIFHDHGAVRYHLDFMNKVETS